jgi:hypothetical protein
LENALKGWLEMNNTILVFFTFCILASVFSKKNHHTIIFHRCLPASSNTKSYNLVMWDEGETALMACMSAFATGVNH